jgi:hypothetical protein
MEAMMTRTRLIAAACAAALALALPAAAEEDTAFEPDLDPQDRWFTCEGGETPEWTVNTLLDGVYATWNDVEPTGSVAGGEGCASLNPSLVRGVRPETPFDANWTGSFRGNIDELTIRMHNIVLGTAQNGAPVTLRVRMTVNGQSLFGTETVANASGDEFQEPAVKEITMTPAPTGATGAPKLFEFTVTDIGLLSEADATRNHRITLTLETAATNAARQNFWAWGNTEAPSGLVFNPEERAEVVVERHVD